MTPSDVGVRGGALAVMAAAAMGEALRVATLSMPQQSTIGFYVNLRSRFQYKAGTEHAEFSPDQARIQSLSAKRRGVYGESHEE